MTHSKTFASLAALASLAFWAQAHAVSITGSATSATVAPNGVATITVTLNASEAIPELTGLTFAADTLLDPGLKIVPDTGAVFGQGAAAFSALFDPSASGFSYSDGQFGVSVLAIPSSVSLPAGDSTISFQVQGITPGLHTLTYNLSLTVPDPVVGFADVAAPDFTSTVTVSAVPELHPAMMLAAGLAAMGLLARRRRA